MLEYRRDIPTPQAAVWHALTTEAENWWPYTLGVEKGAKLEGRFEPGGRLSVIGEDGVSTLFAFVMQIPEEAGFLLSRPIPDADRGYRFISYEVVVEGRSMGAEVVARVDLGEEDELAEFCLQEIRLLVDNLVGYVSR